MIFDEEVLVIEKNEKKCDRFFFTENLRFRRKKGRFIEIEKTVSLSFMFLEVFFLKEVK